ncbi:hypothetical protein P12x_003974 [Tundrisphaera lichenicola]|uniref:hypothetical protein n=1 Tax=Tundrisphaera lichenicola TaxID=2029860 RepID=UPI003EBD2B2D
MRGNSFVLTMVSALLMAGCSTTGPFGRERLALPVGPSYVGGRGTQVYPISDNLIPNVKEAMGDVGMREILQSQDPSGLIILEARTADQRRARVTLQNSGLRSVVSAKVGWIGDEPITRALLDRIASRQGTFESSTPIEAAPDQPSQPFISRQAVPDSTMLRDQTDAGYNPSVITNP